MLATGTDFEDAIRLWDTKAGTYRLTFTGHTDWIRSMVFSPDGKTLASGSADNTVRLWDIITGKNRGILTGHTGAVTGVAFNPDGRTLVSGSYDGDDTVVES